MKYQTLNQILPAWLLMILLSLILSGCASSGSSKSEHNMFGLENITDQETLAKFAREDENLEVRLA